MLYHSQFSSYEQLNDPVLEHQDSSLLATVDNDISSERTVEENIRDGITNFQVTDVWTTYRDTIALQMFDEYQTRRNTTNMR